MQHHCEEANLPKSQVHIFSINSCFLFLFSHLLSCPPHRNLTHIYNYSKKHRLDLNLIQIKLFVRVKLHIGWLQKMFSPLQICEDEGRTEGIVPLRALGERV